MMMAKNWLSCLWWVRSEPWAGRVLSALKPGWPPAGFKAELHFCLSLRSCTNIEYLFLEVHCVLSNLGSLGCLCPCSPCHPARAFRVDCHQQCHQLLFVTVGLTLRRAVLSVVFPLIKTLDSIGFPPASSQSKVPNKVKEERYIFFFPPLGVLINQTQALFSFL